LEIIVYDRQQNAIKCDALLVFEKDMQILKKYFLQKNISFSKKIQERRKTKMRIQLKLLRVARGMTQEQFAKALGYNRTYYNAVENGKHAGSLKFWKRVQEFCNVPDEEFANIMK
jgi:DNA-binding XRE family transcriptional regulator